MAEKISSRLSHFRDAASEQNLRILLQAAYADLAAVRASIVAINAKLDSDAGVTATNFGSTTNPPAAHFVL
jgi:hypothetical protein